MKIFIYFLDDRAKIPTENSHAEIWVETGLAKEEKLFSTSSPIARLVSHPIQASERPNSTG